MTSNQRIRARLVLILIFIGLFILAGKLYIVQIIQGQKYSEKADLQYARLSSTFDRGSIFFETKSGTRMGAAKVANGFAMSMNPVELKNPESAYEALSQYLEIDKSDFLKKSAKTSKYEPIVTKLDESTAESIRGLKIPGISITPFNWRSYPGGSLAAHVLGIVGQDERSSDITGRYGLERKYESILSRSTVAGSNVFAELLGGYSELEGMDVRGDIITSIEPTVQKYIEDVLKKVDAKWKPDQAGVIVMDPSSGQIVSMAAIPTFDPNLTSKVSNVSVFSNPIIESSFELGSIMKPLTMLIALDSGAVTPKSTYNDKGSMTLDGKTINNYDGVARGVIPMQEILSQSLNVGAATIALKVGNEEFISYMKKIGFGQKTGIDEPNESAGQVANFKTARDIEVATIAYGQGIAISPLSATRALAVLANGGKLVTPKIVKKFIFSGGKEITATSTVPVALFKEKSVDDVTGMLVKVVDEKMSKVHPSIYHEHFSIAAKTGTAGIPDPQNGGYFADRYLHSFFGYFPAYKPKFIVFLYQISPKGATYASETLIDPFSDIASFLIDYYGIAPDR